MAQLYTSPLTSALSSTLPCPQAHRSWLTYEDFCSYLPIKKTKTNPQKCQKTYSASKLNYFLAYLLFWKKVWGRTVIPPRLPWYQLSFHWKLHLSSIRWSEVCRCPAAGPATVPEQMTLTTWHGYSARAAAGMASAQVFVTVPRCTFFLLFPTSCYISYLGGRQWRSQTGFSNFLKQKWDVSGLHVETLSRGDNAIPWSVC